MHWPLPLSQGRPIGFAGVHALIDEVAPIVGALFSVVALRELPIGIEWLVVAFRRRDRLADPVEALAVVTVVPLSKSRIVVADAVRRDANACARVPVGVATVPVEAQIREALSILAAGQDFAVRVFDRRVLGPVQGRCRRGRRTDYRSLPCRDSRRRIPNRLRIARARRRPRSTCRVRRHIGRRCRGSVGCSSGSDQNSR